MLTAALFVIAEKWIQFRCPSTLEWINRGINLNTIHQGKWTDTIIWMKLTCREKETKYKTKGKCVRFYLYIEQVCQVNGYLWGSQKGWWLGRNVRGLLGYRGVLFLDLDGWQLHGCVHFVIIHWAVYFRFVYFDAGMISINVGKCFHSPYQKKIKL